MVSKTLLTLMITLAIIIVALCAIFLYATSNSAQKGYLLKQSQIKNKQLQLEQEELKRKILEASTYENLENQEQIKQMEEPREKAFVELNMSFNKKPQRNQKN